MSSRQLEEVMEREADQHIADALGVTLDEYYDLDATPSLYGNDDGMIYGTLVEFGDDADPEILATIPNATEQRFVRLGILN